MALKPTSEIFTISNQAVQTSVDGFVQTTINLPLNVLDQEVLAIYAVDFDMSQPDADVSVGSQNVTCSLTATTQTAVQNIANTSTIAAGAIDRKNDAGAALLGSTLATFQNAQSPVASNIPYIYLLATDDMFLQLSSANAGSTKSCRVRIWAQRMKADAAQFAALVQSELAGN